MLLIILTHKAPWLMTSYGCGLPGTPLKGPSEALLWTVLGVKGQDVDLWITSFAPNPKPDP